MTKIFLTQREKLILRQIATSETGYITRQDISNRFRLSERSIKHTIQQLRKKGVPVMADRVQKKGYWLPKTEQERMFGLTPYRNQIQEELRILNAMETSNLNYSYSLED